MDGIGVVNSEDTQVEPPMRHDSELWTLIIRNLERPGHMDAISEQEWGVLFWALGKCSFDYAS